VAAIATIQALIIWRNQLLRPVTTTILTGRKSVTLAIIDEEDEVGPVILQAVGCALSRCFLPVWINSWSFRYFYDSFTEVHTWVPSIYARAGVVSLLQYDNSSHDVKE